MTKTTDSSAVSYRNTAVDHQLPRLGDGPWLIHLRWVAVGGQLATLFSLWLIGASDLRIGPLLVVEAMSLLSNIALRILCRRRAWGAARLVAPVLIFDTVLLTALLAFSGGPMNPFTIFFLVHVVMASVVLGGSWTWLFVGLCSLCYASLFLIAPVSPHMMHGGAFAGHLYGMLSSFIVASVSVGYFVFLIQRERRFAEQRANVAQEAALKAESFAALTAVAAGAAHELGSPLATIAVASRELERTAERIMGAHELVADARLIREEVDRCRMILDAMTPQFPGGDDAMPLSPHELIDAVLSRLSFVARGRVKIADVEGPPVSLPRNRATQAAAALLQNAIDASRERVTIGCSPEGQGFAFNVNDDGPGIPVTDQSRLGEPFFTTKGQGRGMGLFLVRQFVEQIGGKLTIESKLGIGTRASIVLPSGKAVNEPVTERQRA